ncbi:MULTISPECIES: RicAFT regulatory complex protein RicA family protein [Bacillus]|uniref:RicAFT regulatory complex protein RicA family protein n=1 Tax=Bacillus TaxID=1386 RepID=UPI0003150869|nr:MULTISPECIES: RicAFT regulatory complex protein RicA family protein [Bacillus]
MANYTKDDLIQKAEELAAMMAETEEVNFFKKAEAQIHENQKVRELIASLKSLQKQSINFEHYGKEKAYKQVQDKITAIEEQISEIPVVQEFKQSQVDVNELLQLVSSAISNKVTDLIVESTGGDILRGETGAQIKNSSKNSCS